MSAENNKPIYFTKLEIDNVLCFKGKYEVSFLKKDGEPALFTVILGNNNTGKTTILKMLGGWVTQVMENNKFAPIPNIYIFKNRPSLPLPENPSYTLTLTKDIFQIYNGIGVIGTPNPNIIIDGYGINRKIGSQSTIDYNISKTENRARTIFQNEGLPYLLNPESWFMSLLAAIGEAYAGRKTAKILQERYQFVKDVVNAIFASAEQITNKDIISVEGGKVLFQTALGDKVRLSELGSGYQSLLTWVLDLAYRMVARYPNSKKPLAEPAIVLVDEIDLHLHPEWQRRVVNFLLKLFPKTQFIVTAHSPVVVQSADNLNVILLEKNEKTQSVDITDANIKYRAETFEGWTLQEILQDLMLEKRDNLYSDAYKKERDKFEAALENDDIGAAEAAYAKLSEMLHPSSKERKMMRIQMIGLTPKKS